MKKGQKMPYFELVARKKATQRHIEKRMKLETELGVSLNVGKKGSYFEANKQKKKIISKKRSGKFSKMLFDFGKKIGNEKNGIFHLSKSIMKKN